MPVPSRMLKVVPKSQSLDLSDLKEEASGPRALALSASVSLPLTMDSTILVLLPASASLMASSLEILEELSFFSPCCWLADSYGFLGVSACAGTTARERAVAAAIAAVMVRFIMNVLSRRSSVSTFATRLHLENLWQRQCFTQAI